MERVTGARTPLTTPSPSLDSGFDQVKISTEKSSPISSASSSPVPSSPASAISSNIAALRVGRTDEADPEKHQVLRINQFAALVSSANDQ